MLASVGPEVWELKAELLRDSKGAPAKGDAILETWDEAMTDALIGENAPNLMVATLPAGMRVLELLELPAGENMANGDCKEG